MKFEAYALLHVNTGKIVTVKLPEGKMFTVICAKTPSGLNQTQQILNDLMEINPKGFDIFKIIILQGEDYVPVPEQ